MSIQKNSYIAWTYPKHIQDLLVLKPCLDKGRVLNEDQRVCYVSTGGSLISFILSHLFFILSFFSFFPAWCFPETTWVLQVASGNPIGVSPSHQSTFQLYNVLSWQCNYYRVLVLCIMWQVWLFWTPQAGTFINEKLNEKYAAILSTVICPKSAGQVTKFYFIHTHI